MGKQCKKLDRRNSEGKEKLRQEMEQQNREVERMKIKVQKEREGRRIEEKAKRSRSHEVPNLHTSVPSLRGVPAPPVPSLRGVPAPPVPALRGVPACLFLYRLRGKFPDGLEQHRTHLTCLHEDQSQEGQILHFCNHPRLCTNQV